MNHRGLREEAASEGSHVQAVLQEYMSNAELVSSCLATAPSPPAFVTAVAPWLQAQHMQGFVKRCSSIARMFSIGRSAHGRELWALEISRSPGQQEAKPNVRFVANMHGDEPVGRSGVDSVQHHMSEATQY